jgi:hypothetical protein
MRRRNRILTNAHGSHKGEFPSMAQALFGGHFPALISDGCQQAFYLGLLHGRNRK